MGWALITTAIFTKFLSTRSTVAIGALLALGVLMVVDYLISMIALYRRPATLSVTRTHVVAPDEFQLTVGAPKGIGHLHLVFARFNLFAYESEFYTLRSDETSVSGVLPAAAWHREAHIRFRSDLSIIGLATARRWTTQIVPELHYVPEVVDHDFAPVGVNETGRIREYVPGDRMGMVAWGPTARTGSLQVRAAAPETDQLVVVVDLGSNATGLCRDGQPLEHIIGLAMGVGEELLDQGRTFQLITTEVVAGHLAETRSLALASPWRRPQPKLEHCPGEAPEWRFRGQAATRICTSTIYDRNQLIRCLAATDVSAAIPRPAGPYIEVTPAGVRTVSQ